MTWISTSPATVDGGPHAAHDTGATARDAGADGVQREAGPPGATVRDGAPDAFGHVRDASGGRDAEGDEGAPDAHGCTKACGTGATECDDGGLSTCVASASGCGEWAAPVGCGENASCQGSIPSAMCACNPGYVLVGEGCLPDATVIAAPRPVAPLSTSTVTSQMPTLHWALPPGTDGANVEICEDRSCTTDVSVFTAHGTSGSPGSPLSRGVHYWRTYGTRGTQVGNVAGPVWEFFVGARNAAVDTSWGTTVDVDGDGFADVVIGASDAVGLPGGAYVYLGGVAGLSATATSLTPPIDDSGFGESVASAGDVDGDGFGDVIISAPTFGDSAYVYYGSASGLGTTPTTLYLDDIQFGYTVDGVGDVDGDGYGDVVVRSAFSSSDTGAVYLFRGGAAGLSTSPITVVSMNAASVAAAGDVNGDGFADIVVGILDFVGGANQFAYGANVWLGSATGLSSSVPLAMPLGVVGFGYSVAGAGDVNGDGFADVLVGMTGDGTTQGSVYVFLGGPDGPVTPPIALPAPALSASFGESVAGAGDVDGDGFADILVTTNAVYGTTTPVYLYRGSGGMLSTAPSVVEGPPIGYRTELAGAGDVDGDGFDDVVVGIISPDGVTLSYGSATGIGPANAVLDQYPDTLYETFFGAAVR